MLLTFFFKVLLWNRSIGGFDEDLFRVHLTSIAGLIKVFSKIASIHPVALHKNEFIFFLNIKAKDGDLVIPYEGLSGWQRGELWCRGGALNPPWLSPLVEWGRKRRSLGIPFRPSGIKRTISPVGSVSVIPPVVVSNKLHSVNNGRFDLCSTSVQPRVDRQKIHFFSIPTIFIREEDVFQHDQIEWSSSRHSQIVRFHDRELVGSEHKPQNLGAVTTQ